ncbi:MAG: hypothetical protein C4516_01225 [Oxalobacter sp.]|nr:MAG: hypothetical protein C4516_01225 [Oxalobacter sp.]
MTDFLAFRYLSVLTALVLLVSACASPASNGKFGPDDEAEALEAMRPKVEQDVSLPTFPAFLNPKTLLIVDTGPTSRQTYAVDAQTLTVTPDATIVRYVVVATSSSGAKNVSFEGINCQTLQLKRYAYGTAQGKWIPTRANQWVAISSMSQNQLHYTLTRFFFCRGGFVEGTSSDILERLRHNRPLRE